MNVVSIFSSCRTEENPICRRALQITENEIGEFKRTSLYQNPMQMLDLIKNTKLFYRQGQWDPKLLHSCKILKKVCTKINLCKHLPLAFVQLKILTHEIARLDIEHCSVVKTLAPALLSISLFGSCVSIKKICLDPLNVKKSFEQRLVQVQTDKQKSLKDLCLVELLTRELVKRRILPNLEGNEIIIRVTTRAFQILEIISNYKSRKIKEIENNKKQEVSLREVLNTTTLIIEKIKCHTFVLRNIGG